MAERPLRRLAGWVGRWSVRRRLLLACLGVLAVGLVVSSVSVVVGLRLWLQDRLDEQLVAAKALVVQEVAESGVADISAEVPRAAVRTAYTIEQVAPSGEVTRVVRGTEDPLPGQATLASLLPPLAEVPTDQPLTVDGGRADYRVLVGESPDGGFLVVGASMEGVEQPVRRTLYVTLVTGTGLLAALAVVAWWLLGRGLRPVDRIAAAAAAIADGDLSRRVPELPPSTEVGRLARDLNTMLSQIEAGVAEGERSRLRLREFVADASHELRTPVTAIRAYLELHERGAVTDEELPGVLARVRQETERIGRLVEDLLHLARLDEPRDAPRAPVDVAAVAADCVRDTRAIDPDREVTLRTVAGAVVAGDDEQLRQVVSNLLSNARVHTPAGTSVSVTVSLDHPGPPPPGPEPLAPAGPAREGADERREQQVVLAVADDGPGMSAEQARRAFDRFYRADDGRGRRTGGSGLGLAIVESVVTRHGGTVSLDSTPGRGAVVTVRLPRAGTSPRAVPRDSHGGPTMP